MTFEKRVPGVVSRDKETLLWSHTQRSCRLPCHPHSGSVFACIYRSRNLAGCTEYWRMPNDCSHTICLESGLCTYCRFHRSDDCDADHSVACFQVRLSTWTALLGAAGISGVAPRFVAAKLSPLWGYCAISPGFRPASSPCMPFHIQFLAQLDIVAKGSARPITGICDALSLPRKDGPFRHDSNQELDLPRRSVVAFCFGKPGV